MYEMNNWKLLIIQLEIFLTYSVLQCILYTAHNDNIYSGCVECSCRENLQYQQPEDVSEKKETVFHGIVFFHLIFQLCQEAYVFSWVHALSSIAGAVFEENVLWKAASTSSWNMSIEITDTIRFLTSHLSLTPNYHDITKHLTVSLFSARHVAQYTYMKSDIKVKTCNPCNEKKERSIICSNMFA